MKPCLRPLEWKPEELRSRLSELPGNFYLCQPGRAWASALPVGEREELDPEPELVLGSPEQELSWAGKSWAWGEFPRWLSLLPYEAFREGPELGRRAEPIFSRPWHLRYRAGFLIEDQTVYLYGEEEAVAEALFQQVAAQASPSGERPTPALWPLHPPEAPELHERRIQRVLEAISAGSLYQVNLARLQEFGLRGHPLQLLEALLPEPSYAEHGVFGFAFSHRDLGVVSLSPELFLELGPEGQVRSRPIKGTRPRDGDPERDRAYRLELDQSEKERAELAMVVDLERNDLGKLAQPGSVRLKLAPQVFTYPTIHHREAEVEARLRPGVGRAELLRATMPSGSVTGAPKLAAMQYISKLEPFRRGLYTGALGLIRQDGGLWLSMAIRTLQIQADRAQWMAGGGIVADSVPAEEVVETGWKTRGLARLLSGFADRFGSAQPDAALSLAAPAQPVAASSGLRPSPERGSDTDLQRPAKN